MLSQAAGCVFQAARLILEVETLTICSILFEAPALQVLQPAWEIKTQGHTRHRGLPHTFFLYLFISYGAREKKCADSSHQTCSARQEYIGNVQSLNKR